MMEAGKIALAGREKTVIRLFGGKGDSKEADLAQSLAKGLEDRIEM